MDPKGIIHFIIKDPIPKIFAIVCAFGIWFFVAIGNDYKYPKRLKIAYINLPESLIVVDAVSNIEVTFSGRGGSLLSIWASPPTAQCDLSRVKIGKNIFPSDSLFIPIGFSDVSIKKYEKSDISVVIDKKIEKPIKLVIPLKGSLKKGFSISEIELSDTIKVIGPNEILRELSEVMTESLNVENSYRNFARILKVTVPSPLTQVSKNVIKVNVEIDTTSQKLFINIPLKLVYSPNQLISSPKKKLDTLIVEGAKKRLASLNKNDIEVKIYLTKLTHGEYNLPAEISLPDFVKPIYSVPKRFWIKIY